MSRVETPTETLVRFAKTPAWQNASEKTIASDFFCAGNESNLLWDQFVYEEKEGKLFDPLRGYIEGSANGDTVEEDVNKQLEKWFFAHDSGIAVWISPRGNGLRPYPEEKITIYRIAYDLTGKKVLLGASHQFKKTFRNPEDLRRFIFTEDDKEESIFEIINWLKNNSQKKVETDAQGSEERRRQAEYYAYQYKSGLSIDEIIHHMAQTGFLGNNPIGCTPGGQSSSNTFGGSSETPVFSGTEDQYGSLEFKCPKCNGVNKRPHGRLISSCQHCGANVMC